MNSREIAKLDEALRSATRAARYLDENGYDTASGVLSAVDALREAGARLRRKPAATRKTASRRKAA